MKMHSCALSCALVLLARPALAEEPARVVIEGARYDQRRDDTASTIVVKHDELLQFGDRSLAGALARVPGITVRAGQDGSSAIRLRGLGNGYTQVLLNGVPAPAGFALESIAPELIERVEIVKTASAELGVQGIAGTVNLVLRKSAQRARRSATFSVDVERGQRSPGVAVDLAGKGDASSYSLAATLARSVRLSSSIDLESGAAPERETARSELNTVDSVSLTPRLNWSLADGARLSAHGLLSANRRTADGENVETRALQPSAFPHSVFTLMPRNTFLQAGVDWERPLASGATLQLEAGGADSHRRSDFEFSGVPREASPVHLVAVRIREGGVHGSAKYRTTLAGGHQLLLGWDGARNTRDQSRTGNDSGNPDEMRRDTYRGVIARAAVYAQDDWQLDQAWSLSLGLRAEGLNTTAGELRAAPARLRTRIVSPLVQLLYKHGTALQLRAGLTRTYKAPTMFALIPRRFVVDNNNNESNPDTQGNPDLRPEKAWGLDAGIDRYLGKDAMLGASVYLRRIDDVTVRRLERDAQGWLARQVNGGSAQAAGMMLEARLPLRTLWPAAPAIGTRFSLARNHTRVEGRTTALDGQERASATLGLDYRSAAGTLTLAASLSYNAASVLRWSDTVSSNSASARVLDLSGVWELGGGKRLRLGASNLLRHEGATTMQSGPRSTSVTGRENIGLRLALEVVSDR